MNWTNTREKEIDMWMRTFEKFRNYIWMKKQKKIKEGLKTRK